MTRKKEPKPNYELLFRSAVSALQVTYTQYKKVMIKALQSTWYGDDGNFAELNTAMAMREKAVQLSREVYRLRGEVEKYRNLMEGAEDERL